MAQECKEKLNSAQLTPSKNVSGGRRNGQRSGEDVRVQVEELLDVGIGAVHELLDGTEEAGGAGVEEKYQVGEAHGEAHVVCDDDAGDAQLELEALDEIAD